MAGVTDHSDWHVSSHPALGELESLLRCFICKEFLQAPVLTSCGHTFCLACVRKALFDQAQCPLCHSEQYESALQRNVLLEEVVLCFAKQRAALLTALCREPRPLVTEAGGDHHPDVVEVLGSARGGHNPDVVEVLGSARGGHNPDVVEVLGSARGGEAAPRAAYTSRKVARAVRPARALGANWQGQRRSVAVPSRQELVECPVCNAIMTVEELQAEHIDGCLSQTPPNRDSKNLPCGDSKKNPYGDSKSPPYGDSRSPPYRDSKSPPSPPHVTPPSPSHVTAKPRSGETPPPTENADFYFNEAAHHRVEVRKLPKLNYMALNNPKLKEKLMALGIPSSGTRAQLEARYNEYHILYNANLDGSHPVGARELRRRLAAWEAQQTPAPFGPSVLLMARIGGDVRLMQVEAKGFDRAGWNRKYGQEYRELVASARASARAKRKAGECEGGKKRLRVTENATAPNEEPDNIIGRVADEAPDRVSNHAIGCVAGDIGSVDGGDIGCVAGDIGCVAGGDIGSVDGGDIGSVDGGDIGSVAGEIGSVAGEVLESTPDDIIGDVPAGAPVRAPHSAPDEHSLDISPEVSSSISRQSIVGTTSGNPPVGDSARHASSPIPVSLKSTHFTQSVEELHFLSDMDVYNRTIEATPEE